MFEAIQIEIRKKAAQASRLERALGLLKMNEEDGSTNEGYTIIEEEWNDLRSELLVFQEWLTKELDSLQ